MSEPLAALVSRALGVEVSGVSSEPGERPGAERVRFSAEGGERTLVIERLAPRDALEAQLLPFLARKSDRVPVVHARGIPHSAALAPPWLLLEDLADAPSACDGDPARIVEAKLALERAVAADGPALRALGVPERSPDAISEEIALASGDDGVGAEAREAARRIAKWPKALVHGDLACANALRADRGVVLRGWGGAYLGCPLLDVVQLVGDLVERGDAVRAIGLPRLYAELAGRVLPTEVLRGAEKLDRLMTRHAR